MNTGEKSQRRDMKLSAAEGEGIYIAAIVSLSLCYAIAVIVLLKLLALAGWELVAAGALALLAPVVLVVILRRWTVS